MDLQMIQEMNYEIILKNSCLSKGYDLMKKVIQNFLITERDV